MAKTTRKSEAGKPQFARKLLGWYDKNARDLPWRVGPAARRARQRPNPYRVWLSEIMLQQTTVATVSNRYAVFLERWPTVAALAAAPLDDVLGEWAGLGYYARARNLHKCARAIVNEHGGKFPVTEEALRSLPGVGEYTAAAIAAIAFDQRAIVVDGNIERIVARVFEIGTPLPKAKAEIKALGETMWPGSRSGDFAQGLMDLGAEICRPKNPSCETCPLSAYCGAYQNDAVEAYPKKTPKKQKPVRVGAAFALKNSRGEILLERRPEKGLLGGMLGLPGTQWSESPPSSPKNSAPVKTSWNLAGDVRHTFTHFHLSLKIYCGEAPKGFRKNSNQQWLSPDKAKLPTIMRKAVNAVSNQ